MQLQHETSNISGVQHLSGKDEGIVSASQYVLSQNDGAVTMSSFTLGGGDSQYIRMENQIDNRKKIEPGTEFARGQYTIKKVVREFETGMEVIAYNAGRADYCWLKLGKKSPSSENGDRRKKKKLEEAFKFSEPGRSCSSHRVDKMLFTPQVFFAGPCPSATEWCSQLPSGKSPIANRVGGRGFATSPNSARSKPRKHDTSLSLVIEEGCGNEDILSLISTPQCLKPPKVNTFVDSTPSPSDHNPFPGGASAMSISTPIDSSSSSSALSTSSDNGEDEEAISNSLEEKTSASVNTITSDTILREWQSVEDIMEYYRQQTMASQALAHSGNFECSAVFFNNNINNSTFFKSGAWRHNESNVMPRGFSCSVSSAVRNEQSVNAQHHRNSIDRNRSSSISLQSVNPVEWPPTSGSCDEMANSTQEIKNESRTTDRSMIYSPSSQISKVFGANMPEVLSTTCPVVHPPFVSLRSSSYARTKSILGKDHPLRKLIVTPKMRGRSQGYTYLVFPRVGPNLLKAQIIYSFGSCISHEINSPLMENESSFPLQHVVQMGIQLLKALKHVHQAGYIHRNITPESVFLPSEVCGPLEDLMNSLSRKKDQMKFSTSRKANDEQLLKDIRQLLTYYISQVMLADFSCSVKYKDRNGKHKKMKETSQDLETVVPTLCSPMFASIHAHQGYTQSRRDDIEQWLYVLIYLLKGQLPWSTHIVGNGASYIQIYAMKRGLTPAQICEGCPAVFEQLLLYIRRMDFDEEPAYDWCTARMENCLGEEDSPACPSLPQCLRQSSLVGLSSISSSIAFDGTPANSARNDAEAIRANSLLTTPERPTTKARNEQSGKRRRNNSIGEAPQDGMPELDDDDDAMQSPESRCCTVVPQGQEMARCSAVCTSNTCLSPTSGSLYSALPIMLHEEGNISGRLFSCGSPVKNRASHHSLNAESSILSQMVLPPSVMGVTDGRKRDKKSSSEQDLNTQDHSGTQTFPRTAENNEGYIDESIAISGPRGINTTIDQQSLRPIPCIPGEGSFLMPDSRDRNPASSETTEAQMFHSFLTSLRTKVFEDPSSLQLGGQFLSAVEQTTPTRRDVTPAEHVDEGSGYGQIDDLTTIPSESSGVSSTNAEWADANRKKFPCGRAAGGGSGMDSSSCTPSSSSSNGAFGLPVEKTTLQLPVCEPSGSHCEQILHQSESITKPLLNRECSEEKEQKLQACRMLFSPISTANHSTVDQGHYSNITSVKVKCHSSAEFQVKTIHNSSETSSQSVSPQQISQMNPLDKVNSDVIPSLIHPARSFLQEVNPHTIYSGNPHVEDEAAIKEMKSPFSVPDANSFFSGVPVPPIGGNSGSPRQFISSQTTALSGVIESTTGSFSVKPKHYLSEPHIKNTMENVKSIPLSPSSLDGQPSICHPFNPESMTSIQNAPFRLVRSSPPPVYDVFGRSSPSIYVQSQDVQASESDGAFSAPPLGAPTRFCQFGPRLSVMRGEAGATQFTQVIDTESKEQQQLLHCEKSHYSFLQDRRGHAVSFSQTDDVKALEMSQKSEKSPPNTSEMDFGIPNSSFHDWQNEYLEATEQRNRDSASMDEKKQKMLKEAGDSNSSSLAKGSRSKPLPTNYLPQGYPSPFLQVHLEFPPSPQSDLTGSYPQRSRFKSPIAQGGRSTTPSPSSNVTFSPKFSVYCSSPSFKPPPSPPLFMRTVPSPQAPLSDGEPLVVSLPRSSATITTTTTARERYALSLASSRSTDSPTEWVPLRSQPIIDMNDIPHHLHMLNEADASRSNSPRALLGNSGQAARRRRLVQSTPVSPHAAPAMFGRVPRNTSRCFSRISSSPSIFNSFALPSEERIVFRKENVFLCTVGAEEK